ncbi:MAG: acyl-CoA dehydrogenase domain protein, partial [Thermoleophilia bacterium]|nr:acyl-CoA dehydrogenase domain protein [Thermoleophilia bacterium]
SPLSFTLSDEHELIRSTVRDFAEGVVAPVAEELDRESRFPYDIVKGMADLGIMGITIPEEYGGAGSDTLSYAIAVEELARVDSSVSITMCAHHSLGTLPIYYFGSDEQKSEWLPALASGEKLHAFGLTEPGAGSDAGAARTTARRDGDEWVINGSKIFITNAGTDITFGVTVTAITGEDAKGRPAISTILIPKGTPGYEISEPMKKMGWHASDTRTLSFNDVRVPASNLIGPAGKGFTQFLKILDGGRIGVAALGLGLAQGAFEQALKYAQERNQFGKPIAGYQSIAFRLADLATDIELARLITYKAAWEKDHGLDFTQTAAMAKLKTGILAREAANLSVQVHGGYGFMDEFAASRFYRDAKILEIGEGTNEVQQMVIARGLGIQLH